MASHLIQSYYNKYQKQFTNTFVIYVFSVFFFTFHSLIKCFIGIYIPSPNLMLYDYSLSLAETNCSIDNYGEEMVSSHIFGNSESSLVSHIVVFLPWNCNNVWKL